MVLKIKSFFRDLRIALGEIKFLPDLMKGNPDDNLPDNLSELDHIKGGKVPGFITSVAVYLLSINLKTHPISWRLFSKNALEDDVEWYFVNGITTTPEVAKLNGEFLSRLFGTPINIFYNPTHGFRKDIAECILGRTFDVESEVAFSLAQAIQRDLRRGKQVRLIGHSQGGIIASNVVKLLSTLLLTKKESLDSLEVYTFAGAQDELLDTVGHTEHFANENDFVARIGVIRLDSKVAGKTYVRPDANGHLLNAHYLGAFAQGKYCNGESRLHSYLTAARS